jgi:hypothetical protein
MQPRLGCMVTSDTGLVQEPPQESLTGTSRVQKLAASRMLRLTQESNAGSLLQAPDATMNQARVNS